MDVSGNHMNSNLRQTNFFNGKVERRVALTRLLRWIGAVLQEQPHAWVVIAVYREHESGITTLIGTINVRFWVVHEVLEHIVELWVHRTEVQWEVTR